MATALNYARAQDFLNVCVCVCVCLGARTAFSFHETVCAVNTFCAAYLSSSLDCPRMRMCV